MRTDRQIMQALLLLRAGVLMLVIATALEVVEHHPDVEQITTLPLFVAGMAVSFVGYYRLGRSLRDVKKELKVPQSSVRIGRFRLGTNLIIWLVIGLSFGLSIAGFDLAGDCVMFGLALYFMYRIWFPGGSGSGGGGSDDKPDDGQQDDTKRDDTRQHEYSDEIRVQMR